MNYGQFTDRLRAVCRSFLASMPSFYLFPIVHHPNNILEGFALSLSLISVEPLVDPTDFPIMTSETVNLHTI